MEKTIYMPLVGEATDCWRPVRAVQISGDVFEIAEGVHEDETWFFAPFSRVRCQDRVFADGQTGLAIIAYAVESNPYYRLLKDHQGHVFRIVLADGEESVVKVTHVDEAHEDFVFDLLSTNIERKYRHTPGGAVYAVKFADLSSARLEE
jgi:hypothetical protein